VIVEQLVVIGVFIEGDLLQVLECAQIVGDVVD
jgi:hypothetical protein